MTVWRAGWSAAVLALTLGTTGVWAERPGTGDVERPDPTKSPFRQRAESVVSSWNLGTGGTGGTVPANGPASAPGTSPIWQHRGDATCEGTPELLDGRFETLPRPSLGGSTLYEEGDWIHEVWEVTEGSVELHRFKRGRNGILQGTVLEMNGDGPGAVRQTITGLTPYADHTLYFDYAVPPGEGEAWVRVWIGEDSWDLDTDADALDEWSHANLSFYATSGTIELYIEALSGGDTGVVLDGLTVTCGGLVGPEPQHYTEGDVVSLQLETPAGSEFEIVDGELPPGLSLDEETGLITGTIDAFGAGFYWTEVYSNEEDDTFFVLWHVRSVSGLIGSYSFSEGDGNETEDVSGYGNHGYLTDRVEWVPGVDGSAVLTSTEFNPLTCDCDDGGYVWVDHAPSLTPSQEYTFAGWIRPYEYEGPGGPGSGGDFYFNMFAFKGEYEEFTVGGETPPWDYYFGQYYDYLEGGFALYDEDSDEYNWGWIFTEDLPLDQWFHFAITTDGTGFKAFINGDLIAADHWGDQYRLAGIGGPLQFGSVADYPYSEEFGPTGLDEIRIYDRMLSEAEIEELAGAIGTFGVQNPGNQTSHVGDEVDLQIQTTGGIESFWVDGLPGGLEFDEVNGRITGEFEFCDAGVYTVYVEVAGIHGQWQEFQFQWTVHAPAGGLVANHSFEEGTPVPDGEYVRFEEEDDIFGTWYVEEGEVDLHHVDHSGAGSGLDASAGDQVLELNGGEPGVVSMEIEDLIPGQQYVLQFLCAAHPRRVANLAYVELSEEDEEWEIDAGPGSHPRGQRWVLKQFYFEAEETSTELRFSSADDGPYGLLIDQVEILCASEIHHPDDIRLPMQPASNFEMATETRLHLNQPNPFTTSTEVRYDLSSETRVLVSIFAVDGRKVRTLVDAVQSAGSRSIEWDGTDDEGHRVGSGTYLLQLQAGTLKQNQRLVMIR